MTHAKAEQRAIFNHILCQRFSMLKTGSASAIEVAGAEAAFRAKQLRLKYLRAHSEVNMDELEQASREFLKEFLDESNQSY